jgi:hypothetical protein
VNRYLKYFFIVFIATVYLGGDAINGKVVGGHYFLASHGRLTEVSHGIFLCSKVHAVVFIALGIAAVPLAFVANRQRRKS